MRVIGFIADLPVDDIESVKAFDVDYLGLGIEEFNMGWVARYTSPDTGAHLRAPAHDRTMGGTPVLRPRVRRQRVQRRAASRMSSA